MLRGMLTICGNKRITTPYLTAFLTIINIIIILCNFHLKFHEWAMKVLNGTNTPAFSTGDSRRNLQGGALAYNRCESASETTRYKAYTLKASIRADTT